MAQGSILPEESAARASGGWRDWGWMSPNFRASFFSTASRSKFEELPLATATRLPPRSAGALMGESAGTTMAWPPTCFSETAMMEIFAPADAAKTGGALPTAPKSREPALMASRIGGPEVNWDQVT